MKSCLLIAVLAAAATAYAPAEAQPLPGPQVRLERADPRRRMQLSVP